MVNNANESADLIGGINSKVVELASLVGSYFSRQNFKELLEEDFKLLKKLKRGLKGLQDGSKDKVDAVLNGETVEYTNEQVSQLEEFINQKEEEYKKKKEEIRDGIEIYIKGKLGEDVIHELNNEGDDLDLDALLDEEVEKNILERMRELYSDSNVRELYIQELEDRKDDFEVLEDGKKGLVEVAKIEETIKKAKKFILGLRIKAFVTHKALSPEQISKIKQVQSGINKEEKKKVELMQSRETATVHRLGDLKRYRRELENKGFITFPSRQKIIDEVIEKLVMGENVLLSGPTGTGKTVLAIKALESLNIGYSDISGKTLSDDIKVYNSGKKEKSGVVDEFAMILSGHSGITASEFIAKPALKGQIETITELGKLLKAFVEGKVPIIDEIDLIPNDVLMRVKHLFTLKPGSEYAPQEDGNKRYTLNSTGIIATANIKSEKHPDREELDPAIVRLFKGVQVPYLSEDESYDLALANLMESEGYIYDIDKESLGKGGILYNLVKSLKEIEDNYLGKGNGFSINIGGSDKSGIFLQKAILEIGNFASMFKGFKESGLGFKQFIKTKIIEFVSNGAYPTTDRLLLIRIFSTNGLLLERDIGLLTERIVEISREDLMGSLMSDNDIFSEGDTKFIDSYELANLDPYGKRNLNDLNLSDKTKKQKSLLRLLSQKSIENAGDETWDNIAEISDRLLEEIEKNPDFEVLETDINTLGDLLWKTRSLDLLKKYSDLGGAWLDKYNLIKENNEDEFLEVGNSGVTDSSEVAGENANLLQFISSRRRSLLEEYKSKGTVSVNGANLSVSLDKKHKQTVNSLNPDDVSIISSKHINISGESIEVSDLMINNTGFVAIQVPRFLKGKRLRDTYIGKQLADNSDLPPNYLDQKIDNDYMVYGKTNAKDSAGNNVVNISSYNTGAKTDAVRECMKLGFNTSNIVYEVILGELIKERFGEDYVNFLGTKADKDEKKDNNTFWYTETHPKIKQIESEFGIDFGITSDNFTSSGYIFRDYGVYKNKDGKTYGFLRGRHAHGGAVGGVASLALYCDSAGSLDGISFRPSL